MICFLAVPCSFNSDVTIQFGTTKFTLQPETLNLGPVSENSHDCVGGISASDGNGERYAFVVLLRLINDRILGSRRHLPTKRIRGV